MPKKSPSDFEREIKEIVEDIALPGGPLDRVEEQPELINSIALPVEGFEHMLLKTFVDMRNKGEVGMEDIRDLIMKSMASAYMIGIVTGREHAKRGYEL